MIDTMKSVAADAVFQPGMRTGINVGGGFERFMETGIEDRDRSAGTTLLANVNPTFNWVRLAQRVPVRIALDRTERSELVAGATATVEVLYSTRDGSAQGRPSVPQRLARQTVRAESSRSSD